MHLTRFALAMAAGLVTLTMPIAVMAQSSLRYLGTAAGGQPVRLDMASINRVSYRSVDFVYYLGSEELYSQANCEAGTWTTFVDGVVHSPLSDTTASMIRIVCGQESVGSGNTAPLSWVVYAPPSNIRSSPNGRIQCVVRSVSRVNVYGWNGEWAITDFCGPRGYIHRSQIEPVD
jgi:hypothetical protein